MLDVGKTLREKRHELNKSFEDIHDETRISVQHIAYLEENNFTFLPATYVKSFLKTYASCLGLDSKALLDAYSGRSPEPEQVEEEAQPKPKAKSKVAARAEKKAPVKPEARPETPAAPDLEEAFERDRASEAAVVPPPAKKMSRRARRPAAPPGERPFLEWGLGLGFCLLLILIVFAWVQLHAVSFASSADRPRFEPVHKVADFADVSLREVSLSDSSAVAPLLQLRVKALTDLAVEVDIDGRKKVTGWVGAQQSLVWNAQKGFELKLSKVPGGQGHASQAADSAGTVRLDFSRIDHNGQGVGANPETKR